MIHAALWVASFLLLAVVAVVAARWLVVIVAWAFLVARWLLIPAVLALIILGATHTWPYNY